MQLVEFQCLETFHFLVFFFFTFGDGTGWEEKILKA